MKEVYKIRFMFLVLLLISNQIYNSDDQCFSLSDMSHMEYSSPEDLIKNGYLAVAGEPFGIDLDTVDFAGFLSQEDINRYYSFFIGTVHKNKDYKAIKNLLSAGANPNLKGSKGRTLLSSAVYYGNVEMCLIALEYKASVNGRNRLNSTPLHSVFAQKGSSINPEIVAILVAAGLDLSLKSKKGKSLGDLLISSHKGKLKNK